MGALSRCRMEIAPLSCVLHYSSGEVRRWVENVNNVFMEIAAEPIRTYSKGQQRGKDEERVDERRILQSP